MNSALLATAKMVPVLLPPLSIRERVDSATLQWLFRVQKTKTKAYVREVCEYVKNQAKWEAATEYCKDRKLEFKVLTENELGITR